MAATPPPGYVTFDDALRIANTISALNGRREWTLSTIKRYISMGSLSTTRRYSVKYILERDIYYIICKKYARDGIPRQINGITVSQFIDALTSYAATIKMKPIPMRAHNSSVKNNKDRIKKKLNKKGEK